MKSLIAFAVAMAVASPAAAQFLDPQNQQAALLNLRIASAREGVIENLRDPEAAKFRHVIALRANQGNRGYFFCGEVNAKNAYGAYVGFRRFLATENTVTVDDGGAMGALVSHAWPQFCVPTDKLSLVGEVAF